MFERFTDTARRVIFFARYEASQFGTPYIDTEHLLLGFLCEDHHLLPSIVGPDVNETIKNRIRQQRPTGHRISTSVDLPFSEAGKSVLKYAMEEADQLKSPAITHKHILIGLLQEEGCLAQAILGDLSITQEIIRQYRKDEETAEEEVLGKRVKGKPLPDQTFQKAVTDAIEQAGFLRSASAKPEHLLLALLRDEHSFAGKILKEAGLDYDRVRRMIARN